MNPGAEAIEVAHHVLLALGVMLGAGSLAAIVARKLRLPDVALFLLLGIGLGPAALGWVDIPAASAVNQFILVFGSAYILFDGGASLRFAVLRQVWISVVLLSTLGVLVTAVVVALAAQAFLGLPLMVALLLGSVVASTDPATLVPIFRQVSIRPKVAQTVMSESAFNDAFAAILTFSVLGVATGASAFSPAGFALDLLREAGVGLAVGAAIGLAVAFLVAHEEHGWLADFAPVATIVGVAGSYLAADALRGSGFMAVFVFGMLIGNRESFGLRMDERAAHHLEEYVLSTALILRLLIFILLGAQVDFALVARYLLPGLAVVAVFMLVARPATVAAGTLPDLRAQWTWQERAFMCWTRETGVIPAALAGILVGQGAPGAAQIGAITFLAILATILVQAPTTRALAARLGLLTDA